jgi:hypothetical protein
MEELIEEYCSFVLTAFREKSPSSEPMLPKRVLFEVYSGSSAHKTLGRG